jgi:hypothetical protein
MNSLCEVVLLSIFPFFLFISCTSIELVDVMHGKSGTVDRARASLSASFCAGDYTGGRAGCNP